MIDLVERSGEVIGFKQGIAQIRLERESGCSACGSRGTCASGGAAAQVIHLSLPVDTRLGDQVTVSMPASSVTLAALVGYLLPPVCLLAGAIAASSSYEGDAAAVLGAGFGFVAGLLLARLISRFVFGRETLPSTCSSDLLPGEHP